MSRLKHMPFKMDKEDDLLEFVNSNNLQVVSITQSKNNDYNLFYYDGVEENYDLCPKFRVGLCVDISHALLSDSEKHRVFCANCGFEEYRVV